MRNKLLCTILFVSFNSLISYSQDNLNDINRITLNTYVPEQAEPLSAQAKNLLENKLSQISSNYGLGGSDINPRFVLSANVALLNKQLIPGPPTMTVINLQITLFITDVIEMKKYANTNLEVQGVGDRGNETKAYIDAFKKINVSNPNIKKFIEEGKGKIVNYYNKQCEFIINESINLSKKGDYDAAMLKIAAIPDVCEKCYTNAMDTMQMIYQQKIDKECLLIMRNAKSTWIANQNAEGAKRVAEIVNSISPFSTCEPDLTIFMNEINSKLSADEKNQWNLQIQKYKDAVRLKEEALRIEEETRKESLRIEEEDKKRQSAIQSEAQKQNYSLQKAAQQQEYKLQKADQEAGGFRGFVNSITKLKMTLWRDNSEQYLKSQKVDYSKIKFN
jgi:hypothetical protein